MGKVERLLETEWENEIQELGRMQLGSDEYKNTIDGVTKLTDKVIELKKIEIEREKEEKNREFEENFKLRQMKDEKKDRFVKNCFTGVTIVSSVVVPLVMCIWSTNFEREGTFTTEAGRGSIRELLSFKRKS